MIVCPPSHGNPKCDVIECRYHLLSAWPQCRVDCALDVVDAYPDGAGVDTLGALLGVTHQAVSLSSRAAVSVYEVAVEAGAQGVPVRVDRSNRYRR